MKWHYNHIGDLHFKQFVGQDRIVFNASSGQTHYLSEPAVIILDLIRKDSMDLLDIASALRQEYDDLPPEAELQSYLASVISQLDSAGLIEPGLT